MWKRKLFANIPLPHPWIFASVHLEIVRKAIGSAQHPHFVSEYIRFSFSKLLCTMKNAIRNDTFIDTQELVKYAKLLSSYSQFLQQR